MTVGRPKPQIDTSKPHPARVYDYFLGGKDHYPVDREMAEKLASGAQRGAQINREFMHRAVAWAAREGIDQYLDIGTGIPTEPNLHQVVQGIVPASRIVYTDNDPIVLRHAEALLVSGPQGATDYLEADVRRPEEILEHARAFLDFSRPVALSLIALLHFVPDEDDPYGIARTLVDALPSGSVLIVSHGTADFLDPEQASKVTGTYRKGGISLCPRNRAEVERFFEGTDLLDPGLVRAPEWYRDTAAPEREESGFYVGVARVR
ncbi:SAM-dependent methyltransferase [Streptomyces sp. NPDC102274]|uniref:SAM-dependent methyltransferase n=1 Tax=Streptomyces sp. NPDC102274 TaxID=3366151 RepID=UPI003812F0EA